MAYGKMSGSPFHVETIQYKYAVENEFHGYQVKDTPVTCDYHNMKTKSCLLWNSGYTNCMSHKCRYFNTDYRRNASCVECAFLYRNECYSTHRPQKEIHQVSNASYCFYFLPKEKNPKKHHFIRVCCERVWYTAASDNYEKKTRSKDRFIKQATLEINSGKVNQEDEEYLRKKLKSKYLKESQQEKA